jgi:hypothetical protein
MSALITFGSLDITGTLRGERERAFAQDGQRQVDTALPLRAAAAIQYDRQNRLYTVRFELTRFFTALETAQRFRQQHPDDVFAAGKQTLSLTNSDTTVDTLANALATARIVRHIGLSVDVSYEFKGAPWTFGTRES